jgi:hypothetical protein
VSGVSDHPEVIWDVIDGAITLCHTGTGAFYRLNDSAAVIWEALSEGTADAAVCALEKTYPDLDQTAALQVVGEFIESMVAAGLIDRVGGPAEI